MGMLVAHLCHCGIRSVQNSTALATEAESAGEKILMGALPRGRRPVSEQPGTIAEEEEQQQQQPGTIAGCSAEEDEFINTFAKEAGPTMIVIGGVAGNFLPIAKTNPKQHAIAIVLGRLMVYGIVNGLPLRAIEGFFTQLALADVELGQKYHNRKAIAIFGGIARELCGEITCAKF